MTSNISIPIFPLNILPLPAELVPLHIFEPRYRQLIQEAEDKDISFGIYFNNPVNVARVGSLMKLESVVKRYASGESDIVAKCVNIFTMHRLLPTFKGKMYQGGDVSIWEQDAALLPQPELGSLFAEYMAMRNITRHSHLHTIYQVANGLNLDIKERYKYLTANTPSKREAILFNKLKLLIHLFEQEVKSKDVFHLN